MIRFGFSGFVCCEYWPLLYLSQNVSFDHSLSHRRTAFMNSCVDILNPSFAIYFWWSLQVLPLGWRVMSSRVYC